MEQSNNMEQAGAASAVPIEKKNESRKREVSGKDVQAIRTFLESVGIYEADALRVSIAIADGKATAGSISADDRLALNRYLNSGTDNERLTADNAQEHRLATEQTSDRVQKVERCMPRGNAASFSSLISG